MNADQILILVIGLFFITTGVMYYLDLRSKQKDGKREKSIVAALIIVGLVMGLWPLFSSISNASDEEQQKSNLLGAEAFEGMEESAIVPSVDVQSYEKASELYAKGAALWNARMEGYDSPKQAMEYFNQSIELFETAEAYTARGQLKVQQSSMNSALDDYNRAIELKPTFANAYYNRATVYYIMGNIPGACADWQSCLDNGGPDTQGVINQFCR